MNLKRIILTICLLLISRPAWSQTVDDFFDDSTLHEIRIDVHPLDWAALKENFEDNTRYVADMHWLFNGTVVDVPQVAIRSRGQGSRSPIKPGLLVEFDRYNSHRQFLGLQSFVLRNNSQDPSQLHERAAFQVMRQLGIPTPRAAHTRLYVNDEYIGLYMIVESVDKTFIKDHYGDNSGYLYQYDHGSVFNTYWFTYRGPDPNQYCPEPYTPETHQSDPQCGPLEAMTRTINQASDGEFEGAMAQYLDLNAFINEIAVEQYVAESDGLLGDFGVNNFYFYRQSNSNHFEIVPWDKSRTFRSVDRSIWLNTDLNVLAARSLAIPALRSSFVDTVLNAAALAGGPGGWLEQEITREYNQVRDAAIQDVNKQCDDEVNGGLKLCTNDDFENGVADMIQFARQRNDRIAAEFAAVPATAALAPRLMDSAAYLKRKIMCGAGAGQIRARSAKIQHSNRKFEIVTMNRREFLAAIAVVGARRAVAHRDDLTPVSLTRNPYIQNLRQDGASILWASRDPAVGVIAYTSDGLNFQRVRADVRMFPSAETGGMPQFTQFRADLTGLTPNTNYGYQLHLDSEYLAAGRFRTAGDGPFSFLVCGDTGQLTLDQTRIANRLGAESASFLLHVGDIAYFSGTYKEFETNHFDVYKNLFPVMPYFPCPGNHEYVAAGATPYIELHAVPTEGVPGPDRGRYYSFDWSNVHFVCLDSNASLQEAAQGNGAMLRWLENDLRATRKFWRVVTFHHPPYASGFYQNDPFSSLARQYIVPIVEKYGVQLVLNGHEHSYQRSRQIRGGAVMSGATGTLYTVSGGGGAALYPVTSDPLIEFGSSTHHYLRIDVAGTAMNITALRSDGTAIERHSLRPEPALADDVSSFAVGASRAGNPAVSLVPFGSRTLIRIQGRSLAAEEGFGGRVPGPTVLAGASVTVNDRPIPLLYVSSTRIWAELPSDIQAPFLLSVISVNGSVHTNVG